MSPGEGPLARFPEAPKQAAVLTDFDGTVSEIVAEPAAARPLDGVPELLTRLAGRYGVVGVISGRPVSFLAPFFDDAVALAGLYGLETRVGGVRRDHTEAAGWRPAIAESVTRARQQLGPAAEVEDKRLSLTLHFRTHPDEAERIQSWAAEEAARAGLELRPARRSVELHPPVAIDKGTALRELVEGCARCCYLGDDLGDLAAFEALDDLAVAGIETVRIAARSAEAPPELLERADVLVDGPRGAEALLAGLSPDP